MKALRLVSPAQEEMTAAACWYQQQAPGLGEIFLDCVEEAVDFVREHPLAAAKSKDGLRCKLLKKFPFGLLYDVTEDEIVIYAVMHLHRCPGYWRNR